MSQDSRTWTVEDALANPHLYGIPSFDEYCRNREKFVGKDDDVLSSVDQGGVLLKNRTKKIKYQIAGHRCDTLEEIERIAKNEGIAIKDLQYAAFIQPENGFDCEILVKFMSKEEYEERRAKEKAKLGR